MTMLFPPADPVGVPGTWRKYLAQDEWWKAQADGWVRIADMTPGHRANAAAMMLRAAERLEFRVEMEDLHVFGDAPDEVLDEVFNAADRRHADPRAWIRGTALYRALAAGPKFDGAVEDFDPKFINGVEYHPGAFE